MGRVKYILLTFILLQVCAVHAIAQISHAELQASVKAGIDPYYVKSTDTISEYGPNCITRDVLQDREGNIWLATWHGIIKYDGKVFTNHTLKDGLIKFHVTSCYEDKNGNLWFGTARGGVYRFDGKMFILFTTNDGLAGNSVTCYAEDKAGNLWLGTEDGVSRFDGNSFTTFTTADGLTNNKVNAILLAKNGKLVFGCGATDFKSNDGGVCCYDGKKFTALPGKPTLASNYVVSLFEDRSGSIWIGTFNGLFKYNDKTISQVTELPSYLTYYFMEDKKGVMWFSGSQPNPVYDNMAMQTLYRYDGKSYTNVVEKKERGDFQLFGKTADKDGNIWFGTMKGVCRYDGHTVSRFTR